MFIARFYLFRSSFPKAALWACQLKGDLKLVRSILDSWSVDCFQHRAGPGEAGHPFPSNKPCSCLHGRLAVPKGYDTVKCQKIFIKETCTHKVVERKNPGKECFVSGWVL